MVNFTVIRKAQFRQEEQRKELQQGNSIFNYQIPQESKDFCKELFIPEYVLEEVSKYLNQDMRIKNEKDYLACLHPSLIEYFQDTIEYNYSMKDHKPRKSIYDLTKETIDHYDQHQKELRKTIFEKRKYSI